MSHAPPLDNSLPPATHVPFEDRLLTEKLPPPGPAYYAARRALWLTPTSPPTPPEPSTARQKLERALFTPGATTSDDVWTRDVEKVWLGLKAGKTFKRRLPMELLIRIIHCAWLRDDTWPAGGIAPDPDDILPEPAPPKLVYPSSSTLTEHSSEVTTPWAPDEKDHNGTYASGLVTPANQ